MARLRYQIDLEYRAAELALPGFATGVARHEFINAPMDRVGQRWQELAQIVGDLEATHICAEVMDGPATAKECHSECSEESAANHRDPLPTSDSSLHSE